MQEKKTFKKPLMLTTSRVYFISACCRFPCTACDPCPAFLCMEVMYSLVPRSTVYRWSNYLSFFCMFPGSLCQDLLLFAFWLLGVFVPSPFCNVLFRFSLEPLNTGVKNKVKVLLLPRAFPHRCHKENCFLEGS
jgi:hypothetical protein